MKDLISHKKLGKLPNRIQLEKILNKELKKAKQRETQVALLFIDLDNFKDVNHLLGYQTGDRLLSQVASRLKSLLLKQKHCYLGYFGADEFIILLTNLVKEHDAADCAQKILESFSNLFTVHGLELYVGAGIGIATSSTAEANGDTLIKNADIARYRAKEMGRNGFQVYTKDFGAAYQRRLKLQSELHFAITKGLFYLVYQPQYELPSKKIRGVEALLRWKHPELGVIEPDEFIPIAEKSGLIVSLGEWVLRDACRQYRLWGSETQMGNIKLSINVSPFQLIKGRFVEKLMEILQEARISPEVLELEITETDLMTKLKGSDEVLHDLKKKGFMISIDDFGSGYSSLARLKQLPISTLKIDKSFIKKVATDQNDSIIVKSIIELAQALNLMIIAEGAEREEQVQFLEKNGCRFVQGHYFSKPLMAHEVVKLFQ